MRISLLLILKLWGCLTFAQKSSIEGQLNDRRNDKVVSKAIVELWKIDTLKGTINFTDTLYSLIETTKTNRSGRFTFRRIPAGNYTLFFKANFDSIGSYFDKTNISLKAGKPINILLKLPYYCPYRLNYDTDTCPYCHKSDQTVPILFGLPDETMMARAERGEIHLGGCIFDRYCRPKKYCKRDDRAF